jgi:hypothetical protein
MYSAADINPAGDEFYSFNLNNLDSDDNLFLIIYILPLQFLSKYNI